MDDDDDSNFMVYEEVKRYMEDGPVRFRLVAFMGGIFMFAVSYTDYQEQKYNSYFGYSISSLFVGIIIYVWISGLIFRWLFGNTTLSHDGVDIPSVHSEIYKHSSIRMGTRILLFIYFLGAYNL